MKRSILMTSILLLLAGCINTPNTKAFITPIAGIGIHSFAPRDSQRPREVNPDHMAQLEKNAAPAKDGDDTVAN